LKKQLAKLSAIVITAVLVAILLSQINIGDVAETLASIEPIYLIIGFILYLCSYFFRALRFHILLNNKVRIKSLFKIICVHNMANNILPARTGEISYVYLSKKVYDIPTGDGIASLMIARLFDFITISFLFFVSAIFVGDLPDVIGKAVWIIAGFMILVLLIQTALVYFDEMFLNVVTKIFNKVGIGHIEVIKYLLRKARETRASFSIINSKQVILVGIASVLVWFCNYSMSYILIKEMGIGLPIWEILIGLTFSVFASILPIRGICGFGTGEGVWTIVFMSLGVPKQLAIATGFGFHILQLVYILVIGVYGLFTAKFKI
jgi:uncharacterized protein (TIRG00374 family)